VFPYQVLRYSALAAGVFYGLYHQASLSASAKFAAINREYEHKQSLIEKAKAEYSKKNMPANKKAESGESKSHKYLMIFHSFILEFATL
jgi:F-type H+-transporting ATP synthase subunit e